MAALVWLLVFVVVQVALLIAVGRALAALRQRLPPSWKVRVVQWGLGLFGLLGLVAVMVPTGHGPNYESYVVGHLRHFSSAQVAFQSESGGLFGTPECLVEPARCIPGYTGPQFSPTPGPVEIKRMNYELTFRPGPGATSPTGARGLESWAYVAVPATRRTRGRRSFCLDSRGVMVFALSGVPIELVKAECPDSLSPVQ